MHRRYAARAAGQFPGHKLTIVVDELPAIAASDECADIFPDWFQTLGCEARKVGMQIVALTQAENAKVLYCVVFSNPLKRVLLNLSFPIAATPQYSVNR